MEAKPSTYVLYGSGLPRERLGLRGSQTSRGPRRSRSYQSALSAQSGSQRPKKSLVNLLCGRFQVADPRYKWQMRVLQLPAFLAVAALAVGSLNVSAQPEATDFNLLTESSGSAESSAGLSSQSGDSPDTTSGSGLINPSNDVSSDDETSLSGSDDSTQTPSPAPLTPAPTQVGAASPVPTPSASVKRLMRVKMYNKINMQGKKLVVKARKNLCYSVDSCFDNTATSLAWTDIPESLKSLELFESADCSNPNANGSVTLTDLGPVGGSGNVSTLTSYKFNNKLSSFILHSVKSENVIKSQEDGCPAPSDSGSSSGSSSVDEAGVTETRSSAPTPTPTPSPTPAPTKASGLTVKLYTKVDLAGKKLVTKTVNDVCYSVDSCFEDLATSVEWTKIPSEGLSLDLFESAGCSNSSISITDLGVVGGSGNVSTLKSYKFNNKLSSFIVRSTPGRNIIKDQVDACASEATGRQ